MNQDMTTDCHRAPAIQVRVIRDIDSFAALRDRWAQLLDDGGFQAPFLSWTWYFTWWKHFGRSDELFLVVGEDASGALAFVAPLRKHRTTRRGLRLRELRFLDNGIGPRNDILVSNRVRPEDAAVALLDCLARHQREWDLATLANIDEAATSLVAMRQAAAASDFKLLQESGRTSPLISLEHDFEQYFSRTFDRKHRYNIRRAVRDAEEKARAAVACFSRPQDVAPALQRAFHVSRASWKGQQNSDMGGCELRRAFYHDITQQFAQQGVIQLWLLDLDDQPVSLQYQLVSGPHVYLLVSDYDARFHGHSPGTVLLYRVLEQLCRQGICEFDFCGEAYDYKMRWSTGVRRHVTLQIFGRTGYGRGIFWAKTGLLPLLRRIRRVSRRSSALLT